jgi:hypothetical protein
MKIGVKAKSYSNIIYFDLTDFSQNDRNIFLKSLINSIKSGGENEVDLIIQPNKKENQTETN